METITNLFDALRLKYELQQKDKDDIDETTKMQQKEVQNYIDVVLKSQANKPVGIHTVHMASGPDEESEVVISFVDAVQFYEAISLHIGKFGFFVKGEPRFHIDALLKIKVKLIKEGIEFNLSGKVVWLNPKTTKGKPPGMGIKLYKMGALQRSVFEDFIHGQAEPDTLIALSEF